jgi:hypothetical protein
MGSLARRGGCRWLVSTEVSREPGDTTRDAPEHRRSDPSIFEGPPGSIEAVEGALMTGTWQ